MHSFPFQPKSVISVMMIIAFIFEQMFCYFEGAMGFHCNQEVTKKMPKKKVSLAHNSLMADLDLTYVGHNKKGGMP